MNVKFAFIIVVILQSLDIIYTYRILKLYRLYNPEDKDWVDPKVLDGSLRNMD